MTDNEITQSPLAVLLEAAGNYAKYLGDLNYADPNDDDIADDQADRDAIHAALDAVPAALAAVTDAAQSWRTELQEYVIPGAEDAESRDGYEETAAEIDAALPVLALDRPQR